MTWYESEFGCKEGRGFAAARGALPTLAALLDTGPLGTDGASVGVVQEAVVELAARMQGRTWQAEQSAAPTMLLDVAAVRS